MRFFKLIIMVAWWLALGSHSCFGQASGWQHMDLYSDGVFGISVQRAYKDLLKNKIPQQVIVAIIDPSPVEIDHPALKHVIWTNIREVPANGRDDDNNGYVDDVHGWNFVGVNDAWQKMAIAEKAFYDSLSYAAVPVKYSDGYKAYRRMRKEYSDQRQEALSLYDKLKKCKDSMDLEPLHDTSLFYSKIVSALDYFRSQIVDLFAIQDGVRHGLEQFYERMAEAKSLLKPDDLSEPYLSHSTHIAGIIAAREIAQNKVKGVAGNVQIMSLTVTTGGDGWDTAVSNAIRYAVDNGALIINVSINLNYDNSGKSIAIDSAVRYALSKNVLLVHAAGNEGQNIDRPERVYNGAWLEVGASGPKDDSTLIASFSNYGQHVVDVFAPGVGIYSTVVGSSYKTYNGTSMAAPVVSGLAALILGYYPKLTALQVKEIIMQSVVKPQHFVVVKDGSKTLKVKVSDICTSGGIVNAFNALKLASTY